MLTDTNGQPIRPGSYTVEYGPGERWGTVDRYRVVSFDGVLVAYNLRNGGYCWSLDASLFRDAKWHRLSD